MNSSLNFEYLQILLDKEYLNNLLKIKEEFQDKEIFKLSLKVQNQYETKNEEIKDYMIYFIKDIIDNIINILSEKNKQVILKDDIFLEIVVSYLFKIINSKFNFFPSHKLVLLIYYYLCASKINYCNYENEIKTFNNDILNDDLCGCFENFIEKINLNEDNNKLSRSNKLKKNISFLIKLMNNNETYDEAPYLMFFKKFLNCEKDKKYYYILIIKYLKQFFNNNDINNKTCLYSLLNYLQINNNIKKVSETFSNIKNNNKPLTNSNVKKILINSLKLLKTNYVLEVKNIAKEMNNNDKKREVSKIFDDDKKYYEDLQNELYHRIVNISNPLSIIKYPEEKIRWCIIIKLLDLLLDDDIIKHLLLK